MSQFSREATKLLRAAEDALSGRRPATAAASMELTQQEPWGTCDDVPIGTRPNTQMLELQRQLRVALTEISSLRTELMSERESRSQTIASLGRRWKEEMMVEVRAVNHQSQRTIAELEVSMQQRCKDEAAARAVMQRQLDDVLRSTKVRDRSQFDQQECIQEQLDGLRERLEASVAECGLTRVESVQQLEKERAALSQRLDVELLRYLDMRRDDQREREALRQQLKADIAAFGHRVKELVDDAWRTHAMTLERGLREPLDDFARKITQHEGIVTGMDAKIHDCITTCHAEVRLQTASLQERVSALESSSAVTGSRVDRAERKADAAQEAVSRVDATVSVARETADRAAAQAQRAMERAQRMEDTVHDRDARLSQIESHIGAVATAEKLSAEIEGVRRAALRAESGVDALRKVCERDEQLAEQTRRAVDGYTDRIDGCEHLVHRLRSAVEVVEGRLPQLQQRTAALEETREGLLASAARMDDAVAQVGQRLQTAEGAIKGVGERLEQSRRDTLGGLQSLTVRLEHANEMVLRSETNSAAARAEVDRMDRRVCELESQAGRFAADSVALRTAAEDHSKKVTSLLSRLQQTREWQEQREARMDATILEAENQITSVTEHVSERLEAKMQKDERRLQSAFEERTGALETLLEEKLASLQEELDKKYTTRGADDSSQALSREIRTCKSKIESLESALAAMGDTVEHERKEYVLIRDWNTLRKAVASLESQLHATHADTSLQQQACEECQLQLRRVEGEQRRLRQNLQEFQLSLGECREETQAAQRSAISAVASLAAATKNILPTSTPTPTSTPRTTTKTTTTTPATATATAAGVMITMTSKEQDARSHEDVTAPSVEFREVQSSGPHMKRTSELVSGSGTTTTTPHTHPQTSSTDVLVQGDCNNSPDIRPLPESRAVKEGSRRLTSSAATTTTTTTTGSHRLKVSVEDVPKQRSIMSWGDSTSSNSGSATPAVKETAASQGSFLVSSLVVPPSFSSLPVIPIVDGNANYEKKAGGDNTAEEEKDDGVGGGGVADDTERKAALMQPPHESSSSAYSQKEGMTRPSDVFALHRRPGGDADDSISAGDSSTVVPFTMPGKSVTEASVTPLKQQLAETTTKQESSLPKRPAAWVNDWDDTTESEKGTSVIEGEKHDNVPSGVAPSAGVQPSVCSDAIYSTPRKSFLGFSSMTPEEENSVPRHGVATSTSSSSGNSKKNVVGEVSPAPVAKRFTSFDDTTSEDEED